MSNYILSINPGSTSTKVALYADETCVFSDSIEHSSQELAEFDDVVDQMEFRTKALYSLLEKHNVDLAKLNAVAGRGGLLPAMKSGGYLVTQAMVDALLDGEASPHASNLGALLAWETASPLGIPSYIYDAVTADEFPEIAKITGMPDIKRENMCHVLNMKAASRKLARQLSRTYEDLHLIVAHLGGGISISVHEGGKIIDAIRDDAGPFSPERAGSIPLLYIINMCYSGQYNRREMIRRVRGMGGLKAYFGTSDCREIEARITAGDEQAKLVYEAMAYQVGKGIGEMTTVLKGKIDYIILTGGLAYSKMMTGMISEYVEFIAPIKILPGEDEMEALTLGTLRILKGEEEAKEYVMKPKGGRRR